MHPTYTQSPISITSKSKVNKSPTILSSTTPSYLPSARPITIRPTDTRKPTTFKSPSISSTQIPSKRFPTNQPTSKSTSSPSPTAAPIVDVTYHPYAPVMLGTVKLYNLFMGDFNSPISNTTRYLMNYLAANIGGSDKYSVVTAFFQIDPITKIKTYMSNSVQFKGSMNIPTFKTILTDTDIVMTLIAQFNARTIALDSNAVYAFIIRGDISIHTNGGSFLSDWCGYHSAFYLTNGMIIKYMVIGDPSTALYNGPTCEYLIYNTANGNVGADSMANTYTHELIETTTDFYNAWYFDQDGDESEDKCIWNFGTLIGNANQKIGNKQFLIQKSFQPGVGCVLRVQGLKK
mmetsp:Transcript_15407/g.21079  ORF Transcript_15407/g.21079 Transcript_15407/m.21079 type:complete len:347 (-) Transcript_15407:111-1151(-)